MKNPVVEVRGLRIGEGIPKICVPVLGRTEAEVLSSLKQALLASPDLIEWRVDHFQEFLNRDAVEHTLNALRAAMEKLPLLFTFRTKQEGGAASVSVEDYMQLNIHAAESGLVDLIDLELFLCEKQMGELIPRIQRLGAKVILSNHDFEKTPAKEELIRRLCSMQDAGADLAKIAVMPQSSKDVLTLLEASLEMQDCHTKTPVITMSMSPVGAVSRLCGETFGSAVTFGSAGQDSAPGQLPAEELRKILLLLHTGGNYVRKEGGLKCIFF